MPALGIVTCANGGGSFEEALDAVSQIAEKTSAHLAVVSSRIAKPPSMLDSAGPFTALRDIQAAALETENIISIR